LWSPYGGSTLSKEIHMSDYKIDPELEAKLEAMPIAELRKYAKNFNIQLSREMTAGDIKAAIHLKKAKHNYVLEADLSSAPAPGRWRIMIHKTSHFGTKVGSRPVPVWVNGYVVSIPPGVWVDVPEKVVRVLENSVHFNPITLEDGSTGAESQLTYPFQIQSFTPGPDPVPGYEKSKARYYARRLAYRDEFGYFPKNQAQLREAEEKGFIGPKKRIPDEE
jgi:hypothetical protein